MSHNLVAADQSDAARYAAWQALFNRPKRPKLFGRGESLEQAVAVTRGSLIEAFDRAFMDGEFGRLMGRDSPDAGVREHALALYQAAMLEVFPEEFGDDPRARGVVPDAGPRRVGRRRLERFAAMVAGKSAPPARAG